MAKVSRPSIKRSSPGKADKASVYTLRGPKDGVKYVGITNDPARRATEHKIDGKQGTMKVETRPIPRPAARKVEATKLANYRSSHGGKNPVGNKTRSGGWKK